MKISSLLHTSAALMIAVGLAMLLSGCALNRGGVHRGTFSAKLQEKKGRLYLELENLTVATLVIGSPAIPWADERPTSKSLEVFDIEGDLVPYLGVLVSRNAISENELRVVRPSEILNVPCNLSGYQVNAGSKVRLNTIIHFRRFSSLAKAKDFIRSAPHEGNALDSFEIVLSNFVVIR